MMSSVAIRNWLFSLRTFAAAMLALYIAFSIDLPRPYWAMLTVYIVAQPMAGMVRSKSVYRVIGTVIGGVVSVAVMPLLTNAPVLLTLFIATWIAVCLYASLLDPTPRSYVFMLAGYTTAIIVFPSVDTPGLIFDTALSRVEEITLGIMCMTVLSQLVFPQHVGPALTGRIHLWLDNISLWGQHVLDHQKGPTERFRFTAGLAEIETLRFHAVYDDPIVPAMAESMLVLQRRMQMIVPILAGIEDRLIRLDRASVAELQPITDAMSRWLADPTQPTEALIAQIERREHAERPVDWNAASRLGLLSLMREFTHLFSECRDLNQHIVSGTPVIPNENIRLERNRDHRLAAMSALAAFVTIVGTTAFWIATAWPEGYVAAQMAAVLCCLFARQDDPAPAISGFLIWSYAAAVPAALYLFAILPAIDGFPMLVAVLAPTFILLGYGLAIPAWIPIALPLSISIIAPLALGPVFSADFGGFINGVLSQGIGIAAALFATRALRSIGANDAVRRQRRISRQELAQIASSGATSDRDWLEGRVVDRLGAMGAALHPTVAMITLAELRAGLNVLVLREALPQMQPAEAQPVRMVLAKLARDFRHLSTDLPPSPDLQARIEQAFWETREGPPRVPLALAGLRRALYPDAPPPVPPESARFVSPESLAA